MKILPRNIRGFSLIEIILYVSIMGIFLLGITTLLTSVFDNRERHTIITEVENQGLQIMERIEYALLQADTITAPLPGQSGDALTIILRGTGDIVTLSQTNSILYYTKNGGTPIPLSNTKVAIKTLTFTHIGISSQSASIRVALTLENLPTPGGRMLMQTQRSFETTIALRP